MILGSIFSTISAVLTGLCILWCIGLGIYVLVRFIIRKIKFKRELKKQDSKIVEIEGEKFHEDE